MSGRAFTKLIPRWDVRSSKGMSTSSYDEESAHRFAAIFESHGVGDTTITLRIERQRVCIECGGELE